MEAANRRSRAEENERHADEYEAAVIHIVVGQRGVPSK